MNVYKTKTFARFARKAGVVDAQLMAAATEVIQGRFDADLGGGVFKQRVARVGGGKSGGLRTLIAFRIGASCFFVYGFAKKQDSERDEEGVGGVASLGLRIVEL